jgi:hypothetical protein
MNTFKQRLKGNKIYRIAEAFFLATTILSKEQFKIYFYSCSIEDL